MKVLRFIAVTALALAVPFAAFAQSSSNSTLSALYAELSVLEQQIQSLGGASATSTASVSAPTSSSVSSGECPDLSRSLSLGSIGPDVAGLQTYLAQQGVFSAISTGYFGALTEAAVAQWQENNGIVSGGTADSTGLGVVGPRTRAAMESSCQPGQGTTASRNQCQNVLPPASECPTNWQPITDSNGCTMYYQCSIALPTASASASSGSATSTASCPVVQRPTCSGTVEPFQTNANGCVTSYQCVL